MKGALLHVHGGSGYQNRNAVMVNVLLNLAVAHNLVIEQKYLEPGHTQMTVALPSRTPGLEPDSV
jgi:hypothetical protein